MLALKHLELYDSEFFCDGDVSAFEVDYVPQAEWHYDSRVLAEVTCPECLAYVAELGLTAQGVMYDAYQRMVQPEKADGE